jgi:serine protease Do
LVSRAGIIWAGAGLLLGACGMAAGLMFSGLIAAPGFLDRAAQSAAVNPSGGLTQPSLPRGPLQPGLPPAMAADAARGGPSDFADLAERLAPAVVAITTAQDVDSPETFPEGSPLERYNDLLRGGPKVQNSLGSGFIVRADGVVVTNNHVIEGADTIEVTLADGRTLPATIVGRDPATDIAVLRVSSPTPLPFVPFANANSGRIGQWVIAIGNPFGLGASISVGVISARNRNINAGAYDDFIQTDAAINRGNSGGPLFDMTGAVIGVNTAIVSPTGQSVGVGFATPAAMVQSVVDQILIYGTTQRGWLGVRVAAVDDVLARRLGLSEAQGAVVSYVAPDGPAAKAGLQRGDVILTFEGKPLPEARSLARLIADSRIGANVALQVLRGNERKDITATVARLDQSDIEIGNQPQADRTPAQFSAFGITIAEISPTLRRRFSLPTDQRGVVVVSVASDSIATGRLNPGDVITAISFTPIDDLSEAQAALGRATEDMSKPLLLEIVRDGQTTFRSIPKRPQ